MHAFISSGLWMTLGGKAFDNLHYTDQEREAPREKLLAQRPKSVRSGAKNQV